MIAGRMRVVDSAGIESEAGPGDAYNIPPGHDAWIVGDDTFIGLEFKSADSYAKPA